MSFQLYTGNKLESLAHLFRERIYRCPPPDLFTPETVVLQTRGMADYLTAVLGSDGGIAANLELPFLDHFVGGVMRQSFDAGLRERFRRDAVLFAPETLLWRIARILEENPGEYPEFSGYLTGFDRMRRLLQLSREVAVVFDRCQIYRQTELLEWAENRGEAAFDWQKRLYFALSREGMRGREFYFQRFFALDRMGEGVPQRISVFGVGAMPPVYLAFFEHLARFREVNFFYLNPCREYWGERPQRGEEEPGNPLLASLGGQGRDFFNRVLEVHELCHTREECVFEDFVPGGEESGDYRAYDLLHALQQDILSSRRRGVGEFRTLPVPEGDRSIRVFDCHSVRREVEVLHDQLLTLLDEDETGLSPREIMVMAPDINLYDPYIRAIFDRGPFRGMYTVSDRSLRAACRIADAFALLLELPRGRFEASKILELLDVEAVRRRFAIPAESLPTLRRWVERGAIRWGFDAESRRRFSGVPFEEFSWSQGLERLLLQYVMTETGEAELTLGISAVGHISETEGELLGNFIALVRKLAELTRVLEAPRPPAVWRELLLNLVEDFLAADRENHAEFAALREAVDQLAANAAQGEFERPVPVEAVADLFGRLLELPRPGERFLHGKLTFSSLVPMRSIPMKVVAILGLNEGEFPRRELLPGFNVMRTPRPGDRSRTAEDRYLFLEAILAARSHLFLFYRGRNMKDSGEIPPAPPLAELIDCLRAGFSGFEVSHQKLQPFSPEYFSTSRRDPDFRSWSAGDCEAALALRRALARPPERNFRRPAPLPEEPLPTTLELREWEFLFANPAEWFLRNRGGAGYRRSETAALDEEPFELDSLAQYRLREELERGIRGGESGEHLIRRLNREGRLPVGLRGELLCHEFREAFGKLPPRWREALRSDSANRFLIDLELGGVRLVGLVEGAANECCQLLRRGGGFRWNGLVPFVLRHLALTAMLGREVPSYGLFWRDGDFFEKTLEPVSPERAREALGGLLAAFREGLRRPLPLFPLAAMQLHETGELDAARPCFLGSEFSRGDLDDPAIARCFTPEDFDDPAVQDEFIALVKLFSE